MMIIKQNKKKEINKRRGSQYELFCDFNKKKKYI